MVIEVYNKREPNRGLNLLDIDYAGEITETCNDDSRHLHYFVATPSQVK